MLIHGYSKFAVSKQEMLIMLLSIFNLIFPGIALFWRKQPLQGIGYLFSFGMLNVFRSDIGVIWAIYVFIMAQIHFHKIRKAESAKGFGRVGKIIIWVITILILILYLVMYGPFWTHNDEIKHPIVFFLSVIISLFLPALLLTFWLKPKHKKEIL